MKSFPLRLSSALGSYRSFPPVSLVPLLSQEFKRTGCPLRCLCMKGFPERWIIILRAVYPRRNFPHSRLVGRIGGPLAINKLVERKNASSPNGRKSGRDDRLLAEARAYSLFFFLSPASRSKMNV